MNEGRDCNLLRIIVAGALNLGLGDTLLGIVKEVLSSSGSACPLCGSPGFSWQLCSHCLQTWAELTHQKLVCEHCATFRVGATEPGLCRDCLQEQPLFMLARAVAPYEGPVREALHFFKFAGKRELALPLGRLMETLVREVFPYQRFDAVVPVPLHRSRERERGFNQALLLAEVIARGLRLPLFPGALVKCRETPDQVALPRVGRRSNLDGAFLAGEDASPLRGKTVLLVDDVYTTGATAGECTRTLLSAGVAAVYVVTLASGVVSEEVEA